jgi:hypothetical protein
MFHQTIKSLFTSSVDRIVSNISQYTVNPQKYFSRNKKLPADKLISFLVSEGSSSTKNELLDFFNMDVLTPTASAFNQQRSKLKPDALEAVLKQFNSLVNSLEKHRNISFLRQMVRLSLSFANHLTHPLNIMCQVDILPKGSTVCT